MSQPQQQTVIHYVTFHRVLVFIAVACFFLAAITACGASIFDAPIWAWGFGGFAAWALSGDVL